MKRRPPTPLTAPAGAPAFTMIELLTVIAIIAVLAGMLVLGIGKLHTSAKRRQTEQILANCQGLFAEYESYTRQKFGSGPLACPQNVDSEYNSRVTGPNTSGPAGDRWQNAVLYARDMVANFRALPANAAALDKYPADGKTALPATVLDAGTHPSVTYSLLPPPSPLSSSFQIGDLVNDSAYPTNYYRRIALVYDSSGSVVADNNSSAIVTAPTSFSDTTFWVRALPPNLSGNVSTLSTSSPILLDAWGNPIIFVTGGILGAKPTGTYTAGMQIPAGYMIAAGNYVKVTSPGTVPPPGTISHPFFASAGPDGDFSLGDDNLYSFPDQ